VIGAVKVAADDHAGVLVDGAGWDSPAGFDHFSPLRASELRR
jgi:hypothetical protein